MTDRDLALRVTQLEHTIDTVIFRMTHGEASFALQPGSLSLDDDTKAALRECLMLLRTVQALTVRERKTA